MEVLKNFRGKKLMIAGELDTAVPIETSRKHLDHVDKYHELADTGHMGMFEKEEETLEIIQKFLNFTQGNG
jgi:pimeloyl-ACP methyl ester carboxylesterase